MSVPVALIVTLLQPTWDDDVLRPPPEPVPASPSPAPAPRVEPSAPRFGARGEILLDGEAGGGIGWTQYHETSVAEIFSAGISPGIDYFIAKNFSVGVSLSAYYARSKSYGADSAIVQSSSTSFSGGPRLGFSIPLGESFSIFPRATFGVESMRTEVSAADQGKSPAVPTALGLGTTTRKGPYVTVFVPILYHPKPHVFIGVGPELFHEFGQAGGADVGGERTTISGSGIIGTWWGGTPEPQPETTTEAPTVGESPRFGDRGNIAVTGDLGVAASTTSYGGTSSSSSGVYIAPGFDWFIVENISLGSVCGYGASFVEGRTVDGRASTNERHSAFFGPRVGWNLPLGSVLSFWPRASFQVGYEDVSGGAGTERNEYTATFISVGAFAPLLLHVATHAFVGLGPRVWHDLQRREQKSRQDFPSTTLGGSLLVGGWF
jgi:hypothetical protein